MQVNGAEETGAAVVTVRSASPVPARIALSPSDFTIAVGNTLQLTETVYDQYGCAISDAMVVWESSDPRIGAINGCGLFAAREDGEVTINASVNGISGSACVTVGSPLPFPARVKVDPATTALAPGDSGGSTGSGWSDSGPTFGAGMREDLMRGETFTFSGVITSSVGSVAITAANTIPKLVVTVKETTPSAATAPPTGDIYEYVEITLSRVNPHDIESVVIVFTIPADRLEDHSMAPEDVRLMCCVCGVWQSLETEVVGEESGLYRFRATTPGFSTFAPSPQCRRTRP